MLQLSSFKMKMGIKNKKLIPNRNLSLGIGGILIVAGMLFFFINQPCFDQWYSIRNGIRYFRILFIFEIKF